MDKDTEQLKTPAPTLYGIIALKLGKGSLFLLAAIAAYTLSNNDLPYEFKRVLHFLHLDPASVFWNTAAEKLGRVTEKQLLGVAAGTLVYSLISLVEGVGLWLRARWAGYMAIAESAFFIPIEVADLLRRYSNTVFVILVLNIIIVWYLFANRNRLFKHHHSHAPIKPGERTGQGREEQGGQLE
jgi:uncharacterized membrane protein (DUF2068 family)